MRRAPARVPLDRARAPPLTRNRNVDLVAVTRTLREVDGARIRRRSEAAGKPDRFRVAIAGMQVVEPGPLYRAGDVDDDIAVARLEPPAMPAGPGGGRIREGARDRKCGDGRHCLVDDRPPGRMPNEYRGEDDRCRNEPVFCKHAVLSRASRTPKGWRRDPRACTMLHMYEFAPIERKWQQRWEREASLSRARRVAEAEVLRNGDAAVSLGRSARRPREELYDRRCGGANDAHARLQRAPSDGMGRVRPAGRKCGDRSRHRSGRLDDREHPQHAHGRSG